MNTEKKLYQWDTEQKLTGCTGLYVDFPIDNEVYRIETADGTCIIPDELLQTSGGHKVYECMTNNTIRSFAFSVTPRPKPPDYVYTPTERLTFEGLVQKVDDAVADMIRRAESGEFDGHTPIKGTDYFTTEEIRQIQNEVSSGAIGDFKSVVDTETETFNINAETKLNAYNQNNSQKINTYNTNATEKLNAYNTNANNRVAEFDTHTEQIQTDISGLKSDLNKIITEQNGEVRNAYVETNGSLISHSNSQTYLFDISDEEIDSIYFEIIGSHNRCNYVLFHEELSGITDSSRGTFISLDASISNFRLIKNEIDGYKSIAITTNYSSAPFAENVKASILKITDYTTLDLALENASNIEINANSISSLKDGNITKKVNNIVTNGNFVGTSNWGAIYSTVSASNNILSITGNGGNARAIAQIVQTIQFYESMRVFACAKVRVTNDACEFMTITTASGHYQTKIVKPVKDKWYTIVALQSDENRTENLNLMYFDHAYSDATTANGKVMEVKEVIAFDAMEVFSEYPPIYKLLNIINYNSWWEGEKEVIIRKIHEEKSINNADNGYLLPTRNSYHSIKRPIVTFVNDDGWQDDYNKLVAISEKHQVPFVSALFNGSTMNQWHELYLQNELGWEFASHPRNTALAELETEEDIENAMIETNEYLTNRGLIYHNLVYPYGSNDERVRRIAKKYYRCACTTDANGLNKDIVSSFTLHRYPIGYGGTDETNTLANLKAKVDEAVVNNSWLIFMLHPHMAEHTDAITQMIDDLITYIKSINVDILTLNEGYNIFGNALECGDFTGGDTGFAIGFDGARKNI